MNNWLTNYVLPKIRAFTRKDVPDNLWKKCPACEQMLFHRELAANFEVCRNCGHHFRIGAETRFKILFDGGVFEAIGAMERRLDGQSRHVIPTSAIAQVSDRIQTGDVLAFATSIPGLDVTHTAMAYRDGTGVLRVLHAPLSGGTVEVSRRTLPDYVAVIRRSTGILVARAAASRDATPAS